MDWTPFYVAMAGAAATVLGLLFVAVQLSAGKVAAHRTARWWAIAFSTFYLYMTVFFLPLWFLIPSFSPYSRPVVTLILVGIGILRTVRAAFFVWRSVRPGQAEPWWQSLWYLAGPLILYLLLGYYAAISYRGGAEIAEEKNVGMVLVLIFSLALRNSWSLLVEGAFAKKQ